MAAFKTTDVVALLKPYPDQDLAKGQVGTIVETFDNDYYEVEFTDTSGQTIATLGLPAQELMRLHFEPEKVENS